MTDAKLIAKLLLEDKDFVAKLNKAKSEVSRFSRGGKDAFGSIGAAVGKFAAAIGAAQLATESFNLLMNSSQTLADAFGSAMFAAESAVNSFFHSLGSGDFSAFRGGLDDMIARARDAYAAMDDLGNVRMSYNYAQSQDNAKLAQLMNTARDEGLSQEVRAAALKEAQLLSAAMQKDAAEYNKTLKEAWLKQIGSKVGVTDTSLFTSEMLEQALRLDISANRGQLREQLSGQKAAFDSEMRSLYEKRETLDLYGNRTVKWEKVGGYTARVAEIQKKYADTLVQWAALEIATDEELGKIGQELAAGENAVRAAASTSRALQRIEKQLRSYTAKMAGKAFSSTPGSAVTSAVGLPFASAPSAATPDKLTGELALSNYNKDIVQPKIDEINAEAAAVDALASSFVNLGSAIGGANGEAIAWLASVMQQTASIVSQIGVLQAEAQARKSVANAAMEEAASKTLAAYSGIPFAGIALAMGAIGTMFAIASSVPKFADGGVVTGPTIGLVGEAGAEAIIPLDRLDAMMAQGTREVHVKGTLRARGKDLVGTIENYGNAKDVG